MNNKEMFFKIKENIIKYGEKAECRFEQYQLLDITYLRMKTNDCDREIISTKNVIVDCENNIFSCSHGHIRTFEQIFNKIENYIKKEEIKNKIKIQEMLKSNNIEINGIITKEDNNEVYGYAEWGEIVDEKLGISLYDLLLDNEGRKAKIIIQFED